MSGTSEEPDGGTWEEIPDDEWNLQDTVIKSSTTHHVDCQLPVDDAGVHLYRSMPCCRPKSDAPIPLLVRGPERVNHPDHYNSHPSGIECIDVVEHMTFNVGNAMKYLWRADHKGTSIEDLKKAAWYVAREIERLMKDGS